MYLLDTNVVSELRRPKPHGAVVAWLRTVAQRELFLSSVTLAEIQAGIELTREQDPERAQSIERWADQVCATMQVLAMDAACFRRWARFMHRKADTLYEDAMIAATAAEHGLTVVTRNLRDFGPFAVPTFDPFSFR